MSCWCCYLLFLHAETDVALFRITVSEGFVFESSSDFSVCHLCSSLRAFYFKE